MLRKDTTEMLMKIFNHNSGFAETKELLDNGISLYYIKKFENAGVIERIKKGLYKLSNTESRDFDEFVTISVLIPGGVICLLSALSYYKLTTYTPWEHYVAILRSKKRLNSITHPPIKYLYFSKKQYELGITEVQVEGKSFQIYDMEKTICDIIRYKDKYGLDIMKEALRNYLNRKDRNLFKLKKYGKELNVKDMEKYLEVII
ncbi:type IV toxin-antitoxin system AbiEi family antitoxin domain-containing protein [Paenibacillus soyae]|uniref:Abortive infection protein AbiEi n=1 Tax=Paenibacillus soyae TaxID=2969249 RepID=A0A9X2MT49_9BACL|nr:Abortive infection protein AbiEi [Paenibacillus soyae]MCR2805383.1 Abortive infection protein AbiEi [Paenibacillus soyae]